jgi:hypothetical protein
VIAKNLGILRDCREVMAPICQEGVDFVDMRSEGYNGHTSAKEFVNDIERPEEFTPSTVILSNGHGIWELRIPRNIRRRIISANLRIDTVRTHGMLHSPVIRTTASIIVNEQLVDKIYLVKPHPHGEDFGVDSRRPFQIIRYIDKKKDIQRIRIEVGQNASWDIDSICIEPIILRYEITPGAWMILGAIISTIIGIIGSLWLK